MKALFLGLFLSTTLVTTGVWAKPLKTDDPQMQAIVRILGTFTKVINNHADVLERLAAKNDELEKRLADLEARCGCEKQ